MSDEAEAGGEVEVVDALPVLAEPRPLEPPRAGGELAVQAAAVAATGFFVGAATAAVVRRRRGRKAVKKRARNVKRPSELVQVVASRSFLVDVHLLNRD
jgi:hypothetical protein